MGIVASHLTKTFTGEKNPSVNSLCCEFPKGKISGIVGPDGSGKTTLIRLIVGLLEPNEGKLHVLGVNSFYEQSKLYDIIGYMPQRFGLYEDLTVKQNLNLYSKLQGIEQEGVEYNRLIKFAGLTRFESYLAGDLSGGMRQKLGLICSLLKKPKVLVLDEPSIGVDPLSRRELWNMIEELRKEKVTIIWSTSYLDEAEKCDHILLLNKGKSLFEGAPEKLTVKLKGKTFLIKNEGLSKRKIYKEAIDDDRVMDAIIQGDSVRVIVKDSKNIPKGGIFDSIKLVSPSLEDAFVSLLGGASKPKRIEIKLKQTISNEQKSVITVENLTKKFGKFTAVDSISFQVKKGEIFGLIGPNGAGKSTTFKIILGLLSPTSGDASIAGISMQKASSLARGKLGYMAQKFSLYDKMTVWQNLRFFAGVYPVARKEQKNVINKMIKLFELENYLDNLTSNLPFGMKQRLALSCSLIHNPEVLFLDEPTSGVDPITRREFWHHINALADQGVTILVTTHFMEEAEYCDRIGLLYQGKLRALDSPAAIKARVNLENPTLEDAFIKLCSKDGIGE